MVDKANYATAPAPCHVCIVVQRHCLASLQLSAAKINTAAVCMYTRPLPPRPQAPALFLLLFSLFLFFFRMHTEREWGQHVLAARPRYADVQLSDVTQNRVLTGAQRGSPTEKTNNFYSVKWKKALHFLNSFSKY